MTHHVFAIVSSVALDSKKQLVNRLPFEHSVAHKKDAGHRLPVANSVVGEAGYSIEVVRQNYPAFIGGPGQDRGIWGFGQTDVLDARYIKCRHAANESA